MRTHGPEAVTTLKTAIDFAVQSEAGGDAGRERFWPARSFMFLFCSSRQPTLERVADTVPKLTPADPRELADALAFALRFQGRKRVHNADEIMAEIVARRLVEHLRNAPASSS